MAVIRIDDLTDPRVAAYRNVPDPELLRRSGLFVAEGRLVVRTLLTASRLRTRSVLLSETALAGLRNLLETRSETLDVFVATPACMSQIVGFNIHRGCLALGERPARASVLEVVGPDAGERLVVALQAVANADNVGGIFRNAVAFGADGAILDSSCCDPLYRKAIRVSIGGTLRMPFAHVADWPDGIRMLRAAGFTVVALTPESIATDIDAFVSGHGRPSRLALIVGAEGAGVRPDVKAAADGLVRIPLAAGVDSLNVATAAGIALHRLSRRVTRPP